MLGSSSEGAKIPNAFAKWARDNKHTASIPPQVAHAVPHNLEYELAQVKGWLEILTIVLMFQAISLMLEAIQVHKAS